MAAQKRARITELLNARISVQLTLVMLVKMEVVLVQSKLSYTPLLRIQIRVGGIGCLERQRKFGVSKSTTAGTADKKK